MANRPVKIAVNTAVNLQTTATPALTDGQEYRIQNVSSRLVWIGEFNSSGNDPTVAQIVEAANALSRYADDYRLISSGTTLWACCVDGPAELRINESS